jgi:hypothetical protein
LKERGRYLEEGTVALSSNSLTLPKGRKEIGSPVTHQKDANRTYLLYALD